MGTAKVGVVDVGVKRVIGPAGVGVVLDKL